MVFYLHGIEVKVDAIKLGFPTVVRSLLDVQSLLGKVEACRLCTGHPDDKYHSLVTSKKWRKVVGRFRLILFYVCIMHNKINCNTLHDLIRNLCGILGHPIFTAYV